MALSAAARSERARIAALTRAIRAGERPADDPAFTAAKRDFAAARIEGDIERILSEAPPLTDEQRARLAELLNAETGGDR